MDNLTECRERAEELAGSVIPPLGHDIALDTTKLAEHKNDHIASTIDCTRHLIRLARFGR